MRLVGYNHLISNKREWNNCFIKNNREILLDLADFALQEQPEDNLMVAISRACYNGSYTMAAKPIKSLELHYTMIQFLITRFTQLSTTFFHKILQLSDENDLPEDFHQKSPNSNLCSCILWHSMENKDH